MSSKETKAEKAAEVVQEQDDKKKKRKVLLLLLLLLLLICIGIGYCAKSTISAGELARRLEEDGTDTIQLDGDVKVKEELVINGEKTLAGNGRIILVNELDGEWPEGKGKTNSWGMGCTTLEAEDTSGMTAVLTVSDDATLTVEGSAKVDAGKKANAIHVENGGQLVVDEKASVKNGRYVNIVVNEKASVEIAGGKVLDAQNYGIINNGTLKITGGTLSGAEAGAVVYTTGTATQSGGTIEKAGVHNVYVADGEFTMTGGKNDVASKDGVLVQNGAKAEVKDGDITNCVHGLCNSGEMSVGAITLEECGIMNYKTGALTLNKTTVDTTAVYCLANNGGKVTAKKFTAKKCDTCAIYNFSGDMELTDLTISGSRDGNISNGGGNMIVNGAKLEKCRDKSIVVANGKATFNDVTLEGTSREKYGVYVYGGELYMTNGTIYDVSSTAFKVDASGYVEVKDVSMKDIAQIAFRADGGKIVAENVTMENLGSHAIYNMEGDITITKAIVNEVKKNMLQQKGGTTVLNEFTADKIGNHGAYIDLGKVTITESTIKNMQGNGIYLTKNDNEAIVKNVVLDGVQKQGVNNASKLTIDGLTVRNAIQNGIFNKDNGIITAEKVVISNVREHGINNYNTMTLKDAEISNTGSGSNGLQNKGILTIEKVSVKNSKNHGAYNIGTIKGSELTIKNATKNGVYNDKGTFEVTKVTVDGVGEHGINNSASMTVSQVTVKNTGKDKNSVQNSGTLSISTAVLKNSKNHGVYNIGAISGKDVTVEGATQNGIYNVKGQIDTIHGLVIKDTGSHGINNETTMVVSNVTVSDTGAEKNNIQNVGTLNISNAVLTASKNHGIYNTGSVSGNDIVVSDAAKNGIYNASGTVSVAGLNISDVNEHGINNDATMKASDVTISNTGADKNGIQNAGTATVTTVTIKNSKNHGIYNVGNFTGKSVTVENPARNGVYNAAGTATVNGAIISNTGEHGVNNDATMTISGASINATGVGKNGIQNTGDMTASGITVKNSKNHGIYNNGTLNATGTVVVINSEENAVYNYKGKMNAQKIMVDTTGSHGVNNAGEIEIKEITVANAGDNGIQNSGTITVSGKADITDSGKHGVYNGEAFYGTNININNAGDLALSNGGDDMVIHGLMTSGKASKAIYNSGYAEFYNATIDGTSVANPSADYLVDNNGGVLDFTDTTIMNARGTAIHNRGNASVSVTNVVINGAGNYGTFVEAGSSLSGDGLEINNVVRNQYLKDSEGIPIKNAGKITMLDHVTIGADDEAVTGNGVEVPANEWNFRGNAVVNDATAASYSGYDLEIHDATNGCAVYNKGLLFVKNFVSDNVKDGIASRYSGDATLSGNITLTNTTRNPLVIYGDNEGNDSPSDNSIAVASGANVVIDGAGSHGISNGGSFLAQEGSTINISNVTGSAQGVYLIGSKAVATVGNLNISNVKGNGIYINNAGGKLTATGTINIYNTNSHGIQTFGTIEAQDIVINTTASGDTQGLYLRDSKANVSAKDITISNTGRNGIYINNTSGKLTASGTISVSNVGGNGINDNNGGDISAANIIIQTVGSSYNGITAGGGGNIIVGSDTVTSSGNINISNIDNMGINLAGNAKITASGKIQIDKTGSYGIQLNPGKISAQEVAVSDTGNIAIFMGSNSTLEATTVNVHKVAAGYQGVQLNHVNTLTVGTMTIDNENNKNGLRLYNNNSNPKVTIGTLIVKNCGEYGLAAQKDITSNNLNITLLQYSKCGIAAVHGRVKSGVAEIVNLDVTEE